MEQHILTLDLVVSGKPVVDSVRCFSYCQLVNTFFSPSPRYYIYICVCVCMQGRYYLNNVLCELFKQDKCRQSPTAE